MARILPITESGFHGSGYTPEGIVVIFPISLGVESSACFRLRTLAREQQPDLVVRD
jgi:hypothetical protein